MWIRAKQSLADEPSTKCQTPKSVKPWLLPQHRSHPSQGARGARAQNGKTVPIPRLAASVGVRDRASFRGVVGHMSKSKFPPK